MSDQSHSHGAHLQSNPSTSGLAIASLVCGILGLLIGLTGIFAIILGHLALSSIKKSGGTLGGRGLAIAGLVTGYISTALLLIGLLIFGGMIFAIFGMASTANAAKASRTQADFRTFESTLEMYKLYAGVYPTTDQGLEALTTKPTRAPEPKRWQQIIGELPVDAWGNSYFYQFPSSGDPEKFEITCKGPDGIIGTADDLSSLAP